LQTVPNGLFADLLLLVFLVPGYGGGSLSCHSMRTWEPGLLRARRLIGLPIDRVIHHLAHPLEPPLSPAEAALSARDITGCSLETHFHLSVEHIVILSFSQDPSAATWTSAVQVIFFLK
jgi:hypothetical protein